MAGKMAVMAAGTDLAAVSL
jgi:hypothetical protein